MTRREWRIRRCLRLARNWAVFLAACGAAVALMTSGILWLLPKAHALISGPTRSKRFRTKYPRIC